MKPKQLFRERTPQEFRFPREDKKPLKKSVTTTTQGAILKTRGNTETYSEHGHERIKEMEQIAQREMMELYKGRDKELQEKEEKLRKLERDLNERERMLKAQEQMKAPYDEMLKERDRQIELKMAEMRRRQKLIEEREANLNTPKIVDRTMKEIEEERKEEKTQDVLEFEREYIQGAIGNQGNTEGEEYRKSVSTNTDKLNENQNKDRSLLFPKFSPFSGEDPNPKSEEWKYEVNCTRRGGIYSD